MSTGSKLAIGARAIAERAFDNELSPAQVYRLHEEGGWPIFKLRGKLACYPESVRAELRQREEAARGGRAA
jgi:hypothetical protein